MNRVDDFNRANTTSGYLGTPSDGLSQWIKVNGKFNISTNRAIFSVDDDGSNDIPSTLLQSSSADGTVEVTLVNPETVASGLLIRGDTAGAGIRIYYSTTLSKLFVDKLTSSLSSIQLASFSEAVSNNSILKVELNGINIKVYIDNVLKIELNESFHQYDTLHGLCGVNGNAGAIYDFFGFTGGGIGSAPLAEARINPSSTAYFLKNGFSSKITFAARPDIEFWEKAVTPMGFDGGESVDDSTMFNNHYQIQTPRGLATATPTRALVAYDPMLFANEIQAADHEIEGLINEFDTITILFPNNDTLSFYGFLAEFTPNEILDGTQPTAMITIIVTNFDKIAQWPSAEQGAIIVEA